MIAFLKWYRSLVDKNPLRVPIITSGFLQSTADISAQYLESNANPQQEYSLKRTAIQGSLGFCFFGPIGSTTMRCLHLFKFRPLTCVMLDQCLTSPTLNSGFLILHPFLHGRSWHDIKTRFWNLYKEVQCRSWSLWAPVQVFNFLFIPHQFRILYLQTINLFWSMFLSYRGNKALRQKVKEAQWTWQLCICKCNLP